MAQENPEGGLNPPPPGIGLNDVLSTFDRIRIESEPEDTIMLSVSYRIELYAALPGPA